MRISDWSSVVCSSDLFVFGGEAPFGTLNQVEAYDPAADCWRSHAAIPTAGTGCRCGRRTRLHHPRRAVAGGHRKSAVSVKSVLLRVDRGRRRYLNIKSILCISNPHSNKPKIKT